MALQNCVYEVMDTTQTPQSFFGHLRRFIHASAVYLDLSPPVRQYFDLLKDTGETEFIALLAQQKKASGASPKWRIFEDLADEVDSVLHSIAALQKLEQALEGKYIDFRFNPVMEALNFIFDREGEVLYKLHAKSTRVQGADDMRTMTFAKLGLVGEDDAMFNREIQIELQINENSGYKDKSRWLSCTPKPGQCNFDFDFMAPEAVPTINDLRVTLTADHPIRVGMLFVRQRFYADRQQQGPAPASSPKGDVAPKVGPAKDAPPGRSRLEGPSNPDRSAGRRYRAFDAEEPPRESGTPRSSLDRGSTLRGTPEPERDSRPASDRDDEYPPRPSRDYDRGYPRRDAGRDLPQERPREDYRADDSPRGDSDQPPPPRRRRFQD
jgi:hypothetical protein